jgi:hypothetical protein
MFLVSDGGQTEADGNASAGSTIDLGKLLVGAGEADVETFDLAEPTFTFGFGDARPPCISNLPACPGEPSRTPPATPAADTAAARSAA